MAAGDAGEEFIAKLHQITGAEIAASTTLIGNADKGGNWELDIVTSQINTKPILNQETIASYSGILANTPNEISGNVFLDNNANGANNNDSGVQNITVTAYDAAGTSVATANTDSNGDYTITGLTDGTDYRIEFSNLPSDYFDAPIGTDNNGSVVFVSSPASNINYSVIDPTQFNFNQPLATDILQNGYAVYTCWGTTTSDVVLAIRDLTGETAGANNIGDIGEIFDSGQVGNVDSSSNLPSVTTFTRSQFGGNQVQATAVDSRDGSIYVATSSLYGTYGHTPNTDNPAPGQIYRISPDGNTVELFATLPGNLGTGWLELDEEHDQIYVSNPDDGQIYVVDTTASAGTQTASTSYTTFAPHTADALSEGTNAADLIAPLGSIILGVGYNKVESRLYYSIWGQDYNANGSTDNTIRSVGINADGSIDTGSDRLELTTPNGTVRDLAGAQYSNTSSPVTDIEFNEAGTIMLLAEQSIDHSFTTQIVESSADPDTTVPTVWAHAGRVLEYRGSGNNWTGESTTKHPIGSLFETGLTIDEQNSRGGVDFAFHSIENNNVTGNEEYIIAAGDALPYQGSQAGQVGIYGFQYHPLTGGDNSTALKIDGDGVIEDASNFLAKGSFADVDIRVAYQFIEIGDRIFNDTNANGIQDPGEAGIEDVTVNLFQNGSSIGNATTDINGQYIFGGSSNTNLNSGQSVQPNTDYEIRIDSASASLSGLNLTVANQESNDLIDSDAVNVSSTPTITFTTGDWGESDFTLDAGFTAQEFDYGDAPDTGDNTTGTGDYLTTEANGGASHIITTGLSIGSEIDAEDGTQQNITADADDSDTDPNDEDGIDTTTLDILSNNSDTYSIDVDVTNTTGGDATLIGWIDFDGDGVFEEDEATTALVSNGDTAEQLDWSDLQSLTDGINAGTTYARFRLSSDFNGITIDDNTSVGAATDGEVEDYQITIKNEVTGTGASEEISTSGTSILSTDDADLIIAGAGQDTLTGGDGNDCFHFNQTSDGVDIITDFKDNGDGDKLDFSDIFDNELSSLTIPTNSNPYDEGYVEAITYGSGVMIVVDKDPNDSGDDLLNKDVVLLRNTNVSDIDASDFIF